VARQEALAGDDQAQQGVRIEQRPPGGEAEGSCRLVGPGGVEGRRLDRPRLDPDADLEELSGDRQDTSSRSEAANSSAVSNPLP
jgi:hypothetical protein